MFIFRCTDCDKVFMLEYSYKRHMKTHEKTREQRKPYTCPICHKNLSTESSLKNHMKLHDTENDQLCKDFILENFDITCDMDGCNVVCSSFYDARKHYKEAHDYDQGYIKCCNMKFHQHWMAIDHVQTHLNPEHFKYVASFHIISIYFDFVEILLIL